MPYLSATQRLYQGVVGVSDTIRALCGARPELSNRKQIFRHRASQASFFTFSTCSPRPTFDTTLFVIQCAAQLETLDGSDAGSKGCVCRYNDDAGCGAGSRLRWMTTPNQWYYVLVTPHVSSDGGAETSTYSMVGGNFRPL